MSLVAFLTGSTVPPAAVPIAKIGAQPAYGVIGSVIRLNAQGSADPAAQSPKSGNDGTTASPDLLNAASGNFTSLDINRIVTLSGGKDSGSFRITSVISPTQVEVVDSETGGSPVFLGGSTSWSISNFFSYAWSFVRTPIGSKVVQEGFRLLESDGSLVSFSPDVVGEYVVGLTVSNGAYTSSQVTSQVSIRAILVPHGRGLVPDGKWIWSYIRDVWNDVENREWFETFWSAGHFTSLMSLSP